MLQTGWAKNDVDQKQITLCLGETVGGSSGSTKRTE
jgi:hypothetical protein